MSAVSASDALLVPLLEAVRRFATRELQPLENDRAAAIPERALEGLRELGLFGLTLPTSAGGAGLGLPEASAVVAALAEVDRSVAVTLGLHLGLGTRGLVAYGKPALRERLLPLLASGERIGAFATTEPGAGSDLSLLATRARPDGEGWRVNGQKAFVTNGGLCGVLTVAAQQEGPAAPSTMLLVLEPGQPGIAIGAEERKLGLKASSTTPIYLDEVAVKREAVLGKPGEGAAQLAHILCWGRLLMSAGCVGAARAALGRAVEYTAQRRQFKKPLAAQDVVRRRLTEMSARLFGMHCLVLDAAHAKSEAALVALSTSAKLLCSEGGFSICDGALQLFGGAGYLEETGLALMLRDVRVTRIFEGANDVLWTHRGTLFATQPVDLVSGRPFAAAHALREVLVSEEGVRLLGKKEALHRLGRAAMWSDAAHAAVRRARNSEERALAGVLEEQALEGIACALKPAAGGCDEAHWRAALNPSAWSPP